MNRSLLSIHLQRVAVTEEVERDRILPSPLTSANPLSQLLREAVRCLSGNLSMTTLAVRDDWDTVTKRITDRNIAFRAALESYLTAPPAAAEAALTKVAYSLGQSTLNLANLSLRNELNHLRDG